MEDKKLKELVIEKLKHNTNFNWAKLSPDQRDRLVDRTTVFFKSKLARTEKTLRDISNKKENYKLLFLGIGIGVMGNLVANIIDRSFSHGFLYNTILVLLFLLVCYLVLLSLNNQIAEKYEKDELLGSLLKAMKNDPKLIESLKRDVNNL